MEVCSGRLLNSKVAGRSGPAVRRMVYPNTPVHLCLLVAGDTASIGRAVVDQKNFQVWIGLRFQALYSAGNECLHVIDGDDNTDQFHLHGIPTSILLSNTFFGA